jgi:hypothetical protein
MRTALRLLPTVLAVAACAPQTDAPWLTSPGVDGHAKYLPLAGSSHDPGLHPTIRCESCHPGTTFREPVCTDCHKESETTPLHTSGGRPISGYVWTPPPSAGGPWQRPSCLSAGCHPKGGVSDLDHGRWFPVGAGTKHTVRTCTTCHTDPLDKGNLSKLACITCHAGSAVARPLPGTHTLLLRESYPTSPTPADCLRCHDASQVLRIGSHGKLRGPTGFGGAGPWDGDHGQDGAAVNCFACHDAPPPLFNGKGAGVADRPWAQDWRIPAVTAGQTASTACRGCHGVK